ncbi:hypothetical protein HZF05_09215 [Sphingomonas sp. CGMCC 1.13654]|uniref:MFS transporter n=1 Tax=Sphingomonas chungangi TaxID=2683589 RepID=A0A838L9U4_9SPHN|nr:hypothetical protein [Sphingomonas chungangi]MBA2934278.1 hypothetical protein [Sphingomonas chungangi]MVW57319.1 hypothetical protein [Sphingomonas chungangi]
MNNVLGMLIGAAIDREDGDSGVEGAIGGYLAEGALKLVAPLVVTFAIGWGVQFLLRRGIEAITGEDAAATD